MDTTFDLCEALYNAINNNVTEVSQVVITSPRITGDRLARLNFPAVLIWDDGYTNKGNGSYTGRWVTTNVSCGVFLKTTFDMELTQSLKWHAKIESALIQAVHNMGAKAEPSTLIFNGTNSSGLAVEPHSSHPFLTLRIHTFNFDLMIGNDFPE